MENEVSSAGLVSIGDGGGSGSLKAGFLSCDNFIDTGRIVGRVFVGDASSASKQLMALGTARGLKTVGSGISSVFGLETILGLKTVGSGKASVSGIEKVPSSLMIVTSSSCCG